MAVTSLEVIIPSMFLRIERRRFNCRRPTTATLRAIGTRTTAEDLPTLTGESLLSLSTARRTSDFGDSVASTICMAVAISSGLGGKTDAAAAILSTTNGKHSTGVNSTQVFKRRTL